jgi:hypothetical protein
MVLSVGNPSWPRVRHLLLHDMRAGGIACGTGHQPSVSQKKIQARGPSPKPSPGVCAYLLLLVFLDVPGHPPAAGRLLGGWLCGRVVGGLASPTRIRIPNDSELIFGVLVVDLLSGRAPLGLQTNEGHLSSLARPREATSHTWWNSRTHGSGMRRASGGVGVKRTNNARKLSNNQTNQSSHTSTRSTRAVKLRSSAS